MTASEIQNIVITVGLTQVCCDLFFNYWTFSGDKYKRLIGAMERAKFKVEKAEADLKKNPNKNAKRHQRAKDDFSTAQAEVAKQVRTAYDPHELNSSIIYFFRVREQSQNAADS